MRVRSAPVWVLLCLVMTACSQGDPGDRATSGSTGTATTTAASPSPTATAPSSTAPTRTAASPSPTRTQTPGPARLRGVDVSHHQGDIDWPAVAGDDIDFAYLKATEGSGFADDRFTANAAAAASAGLEVGGYHYYTLCGPPEPQADHFVATLRQAKTNLPPVVDLELIGNCDPPPARDALLGEVETFIDRVEAATGRRVVVYFHPDFEAHYAMVDDLDRRLWVRRVGQRPPPGDWFIWQRDDRGSVAGVSTPVDVDVMRR